MENAIVKLTISKNIFRIRKHPDRAHVLYVEGEAALPVHIEIGHHSYRSFASKTVVGVVRSELITENGGQLRRVPVITPVEGSVANAHIKYVGSGEFEVVALPKRQRD